MNTLYLPKIMIEKKKTKKSKNNGKIIKVIKSFYWKIYASRKACSERFWSQGRKIYQNEILGRICEFRNAKNGKWHFRICETIQQMHSRKKHSKILKSLKSSNIIQRRREYYLFNNRSVILFFYWYKLHWNYYEKVDNKTSLIPISSIA